MVTQRFHHIREIKDNPENKIFFNNAKFHEDKGYKVIKEKDLFRVLTGHGYVYYELNGTKIGDCIKL